jgi:inner membrane protein
LEPVTHFLFGGVLARAGLNRKSALATATLVLAAEAPDLDILTEFGGRIFGFEHHRGITHTLLGAPLISALVVGFLWLYWRWLGHHRKKAWQPHPRWGVLFGFGCLAAASHILLDFTNNYGVRPFAPFSYRWFSWDIVFIAEPVLWVLLVGGLVLPSLFGLVSDEVRSSRVRGPRGRAGAIAALVLVAAFWGLRDYEHRRAIAEMEALTYRGQEPVRISAYPYYINPFRWYGVVETASFYQRMRVNTLNPAVDPDGRAIVQYKPEETPVITAAKRSWLGRIYLDWAQYPLLEVEQLSGPERGYLVRLNDVRFMYPEFASRNTLGAWVQLDPQLEVVAQSFGPWQNTGKQQVASK